MRRRAPRPDHVDGQRRLRRIAKDICIAAGLDPNSLSAADRIRVAQAAFATLCRDNLQVRALSGAVVDIGELERINAALQAILPQEQTRLDVRLVDSFMCPRCKIDTTAEAEAAKAEAMDAATAEPCHLHSGQNVPATGAARPAPSTRARRPQSA